ncbi:MAG: GTP-binding protein [Candidatus Brocadia sp. AMX2]|nr:MAG: GTP-binding protein [Candidatus Brocadia sp. AMX2]MBC6933348.1 GTP-binding protein [Candidatus Brocadia sp.]MBL1169678.1 GTP-binding protein [Candidatus Brocadia sp. AMX1]MCE7868218.1 GTP-binding protein [Candidatus Brocadia sp. AMX2]MCQ3918418.1 GTP-binding protein [Candidatus Brocadia sp.]
MLLFLWRCYSMLEEFIRHKTEILGTIENIVGLIKDDTGAVDNRLHMIKEQLISNCFNLVILGQFKRGKTTLINSLIGKEILPSSVVPLTSVVTILKYSEEVSCVVSMEDGNEKKIRIEELPDYVTEKGNPKNIRGVRCARIGYPSPFLEKGILLVDTPGVGSTFLHNTETTYEFLDHLDAALFLMSADVPISQVEKELLDTIKDSTQKIFFVLNKIDNLTPKEIEEIAAFNKQVLEEMGFTVQEIWPISAREALKAKTANNDVQLSQSGLLNLEDALGSFLSLEKGKIVLNTTISKTKRVISQKLSQIAIERKTMEASGEELENKINTFHQLVANLKQDREDMKYLLKGESDKLCFRVEEMLKILEEKETPRVKQCLTDFYEKNPDLNPTALRDEMQKVIKEEIVRGFDAFRKDTEKVISNNIQETFSRFTKRSNNIINEFKTAAEILFEVSMEQYEFSVELARDTGFYYMVQEYTAPTEEEVKSILRAFLPKSLSRKMVLNEMMERVSSDVGRNCGRTRSDLTTRICKTIDHYSKQLKDLGSDLIAQIEQAIQKGQERRRAGSESVRFELELLASKAKALEGYKENLEKVWNMINPVEISREQKAVAMA